MLVDDALQMVDLDGGLQMVEIVKFYELPVIAGQMKTWESYIQYSSVQMRRMNLYRQVFDFHGESSRSRRSSSAVGL